MDEDYNGEDFGGDCADNDFYSNPNNLEPKERFEKSKEAKPC
jgi:hypothetical protein